MDRGDPQLVSRARGALLGLVAGNQLGVPTEHLGTPEAIRKAFPNGVVDLAPPPKNSPYDDDAAMALLLGESLLASQGFDENDVARRWVKWMKVDGRGIGTTTRRALTLVDRGKERLKAWLVSPKKEEIGSIVTAKGRAEILSILSRLVAEAKLSPRDAERITKKVAGHLFGNDPAKK